MKRALILVLCSLTGLCLAGDYAEFFAPGSRAQPDSADINVLPIECNIGLSEFLGNTNSLASQDLAGFVGYFTNNVGDSYGGISNRLSAYAAGGAAEGAGVSNNLYVGAAVLGGPLSSAGSAVGSLGASPSMAVSVLGHTMELNPLRNSYTSGVLSDVRKALLFLCVMLLLWGVLDLVYHAILQVVGQTQARPIEQTLFGINATALTGQVAASVITVIMLAGAGALVGYLVAAGVSGSIDSALSAFVASVGGGGSGGQKTGNAYRMLNEIFPLREMFEMLGIYVSTRAGVLLAVFVRGRAIAHVTG